MVGCEANKEDVRISDNTSREIGVANTSSTRYIVRLIDEPTLRIDHISESEFAPIQRFLEVGRLEADLEGQFVAHGKRIGVDPAYRGGVQCSFSFLIIGNEQAKSAHQASNVLVIAGTGGNERTGERWPLVAVIQHGTRATHGSSERGVQVQRVRVELRELRILGPRGERSQQTYR